MSWFVPSAPGRSTRNQLDPVLEIQFQVLFGSEPPVSAKMPARKIRSDWEQARRLFAGFATPNVPPQQLGAALNDFEFFGFDRPAFFRIRDGRVLARFPGAPIDINPDEASIVIATGQTIAVLQSSRIEEGSRSNPSTSWFPITSRSSIQSLSSAKQATAGLPSASLS